MTRSTEKAKFAEKDLLRSMVYSFLSQISKFLVLRSDPDFEDSFEATQHVLSKSHQLKFLRMKMYHGFPSEALGSSRFEQMVWLGGRSSPQKELLVKHAVKTFMSDLGLKSCKAGSVAAYCCQRFMVSCLPEACFQTVVYGWPDHLYCCFLVFLRVATSLLLRTCSRTWCTSTWHPYCCPLSLPSLVYMLL